MVFFSSAFYQHVVDVDLNIPPNLVPNIVFMSL